MENCKLPDYSNIPEEALQIVSETKTIALVGASPKEERPSHQVMKYLLEKGFKVIPVNPGQKEILGQKCYPSISAISEGEKVDTAIIFRRSDLVLPIVEEALSRGIKNIWLQEGIVNEEAQKLAHQKGARIVMNLCFKKVHLAGAS
ncbi:CoA-binding domain protein [Thermodesulfatator indicus DSM 15286]|uniref:CoA-binding domain protein n=1 Tax=Thermodesulfatator indicus (strain DSM 15286 / JCM 11887 / CIR29812) TaxID=667014 RepID=F8ABJ1_THEID|nr:CoA-binding protein [Thermodesulfatator indicus]AEH45588.1 CoA-binding domain protein [Thermodesulfatator indicus DSM 15286]